MKKDPARHYFRIIWHTVLLIIIFVSSSFCQTSSIDEELFVPIGGIEQWITIKGNDRSKPAILFLHGGPGSVLSPYSEAIFGEWKDDFILVNWDQRGAGRTYGRNVPDGTDEDYWIENPLTLDKFVSDGLELTKYILAHLNKEKIFLFGTSWGTAPGTSMALEQPELYYAYIGHSQIVNFNENYKLAYQKTLTLARSSGDAASVEKLQSLGEPPYNDARSLGQLLQIVKKYERENSVAAPAEWWVMASEYDNETDKADSFHGDDYSFLYFGGLEKLGIKPMAGEIDFTQNGAEFQLPVYFIQGEEDILTAKELSKPYFDAIRAPEKEYFLIPGAAHGFNQAVTDTLYEILKNCTQRLNGKK